MPLFRGPDENFERPSRLELILQVPLKYLISIAYRLSNRLRAAPRSKKPAVRVVCVSDTHTLKHDNIPDGDLLIHAGDMTNKGNLEELQHTLNWIASQPHKYKVVIAGNHDTYLDPRSRRTLSEGESNGRLDWKGIHYLQHNSVTLAFPNGNGAAARRLTVYGAPQIPACGGSEFAFQYPRGKDAWSDTIPSDIDVLVTHTPPAYHKDLMNPHMGCEHLLAEVWRVRPKLHVFGHVHAAAGREVLWWDEAQRAYEKAMARRSTGLIMQAFDVVSWIALAKVLLYGATGVIWNRIWGGQARSTIVVNAALFCPETGKLDNKIQVVDI